jgi:outer membrane protein assembly factor BamB
VIVGTRGSGHSGAWPRAELDLHSTRSNPSSAINRHTVVGLHVAWRFRLPIRPPDSSGSVTATPVVADGVVYAEDMLSNVYALSVTDGALLWEHKIGYRTPGPNGLAVADGRIYGVTDESVFALDARTGNRIWNRRILSNVEYFVDTAPQVADGLVFASTIAYAPRGRGALYALDASTGAIRWRFDTIAKPWLHPLHAGGGGAWYPPSVDGGEVFWGIANPTPWGGSVRFPNGSAFPGPTLYTDSLVVLDARTGRLVWYDQVTPHDVRDYDFEAPPVLSGHFVYGAGKAGLVIAWNRDTHARVWQTKVGVHRNDSGPLPAQKVEVCPGLLGGVETPMAYQSGRLFVPVVNLCARGSATGYAPLASLNPEDGNGALVAVDTRTGAHVWERQLPKPSLGCATVAAGVVFTSTFDGALYGFDTRSGATLWRSRTDAGINTCPALSGDKLIVAAGLGPHGEIVAFATR